MSAGDPFEESGTNFSENQRILGFYPNYTGKIYYTLIQRDN